MITTGPSPPKQMLFHAEINSGLSCPRDEPGMAAATHPALEPGLGKGSLSLPRSRGGSEKGFKKELRLFDSCAEDFPGAARRGSIPVVGTGLVPRCCLQPSRAPAARGEEGTGGAFFLAGKKKNQSAFSSAAHIRAGCKKTCSLPPETPQLLQQLQSAETASLCHPPLPQNKVEQGKWRGGGKGNGRDDPQQPRLLHALFPPQHGCCVPVGTDKHLVSRSLRFHSADLQPGTAWQSTISSQPAHPTHPHAAGRGCAAGDAMPGMLRGVPQRWGAMGG